MRLEIGKMLCAKPRVARKQESLLCHKQAVTMLTQSGHVDEQLKERLGSESKEGKLELPPENCPNVSYLSRHGIALRKGKQMASKTRSQILSSSSFSELKTMKCFVSGLKSYDKHVSPNGQNEILHIIALKVLCGIVSDIAKSGHYSIMADESTGASNTEQLVICICWVDNEMTVCEEYGRIVPQTNADTIVVCIKDVLLRMNLRIQDVRGHTMMNV